MLTLAIDAAFQAPTGRTSAGYVAHEAGQPQAQKKTRLANAQDNHEAEFAALLWAIGDLQPRIARSPILKIQSDSKLLIDALEKNYAKHYQAAVDQIIQALPAQITIILSWVPEKDNRGPHQLALQALAK
ncbi:reverse transcriptase-like protein [Leuconostocaceae bacterium ESL0958]|nr:reverse transcriptase-like protein [Leuconostocaceae bacterium ESL0958]